MGERHEAPPLRALAEEMKQKGMIEEAKVMEIDRTIEFYEDIDSRLFYYLPVVMHIRGETGTGKSTVGIAVMMYIIGKLEELMEKGRYREKIVNELARITENIGRMGHEMDRFIFSDQTEFSRFIRMMWALTCTVIDENSRFASTGYSASAEESSYAYYSDTFAQMLTHRILCSPATITDINSTIILDVMGTDLKGGTTKLKISYRDTTDGTLIVLGYIVVDVRDALEQEFYKRYRKKKFARMELLARHGKRDIRELEFDYIAYKVFEQLKGDSIVDKLTTDEVEGVLDIIKREEGRIYSMLADQLIVRKAKTLIALYATMNRAKSRYQVIYSKAKEGNGENSAKIQKEEQLKVIKSKEKRFERLEGEMKKMSKLYKEWMRI